MLCAMCYSIFQKPDRGGQHHPRRDLVLQAAEVGCKICLAIKENIEDTDTTDSAGMALDYKFGYGRNASDDEENIAHLFIRNPLGHGHSWSVMFHIYRSKHIRPGNDYTKFMKLVTEDLDVAPWLVRQDRFFQSFPANTSHPQVAQVASRWLDRCLQSHKSCQPDHGNFDPENFPSQFPDGKTRWLPKRLLDLSNPEKPYLLETVCEKTRLDGRYAAVSHCWGGKTDFLTLSSDNEKALKETIRLEDLPRSFRDAALTAVRLGIHYLWIDSLCILQSGAGSEEDWQEHVRDMQLVYLNSVVTISIDRAENPHQGAFAARDTYRMQPGYVRWNRGAGDKDFWAIFDARNDPVSNIPLLPLQQRAWSFQERLLSPRILHFCSDQLVWECQEAEILTESLSEGHPVFSSQWRESFPFTIPRPRSYIGGSKLEHTLSRIVRDYNDRSLSFPEKDKLVAFAGVAMRFGVFYKHDYVAGFFRQQLPLDLCWYSPRCKRPKGQHYRAPSWSWASVDGSIRLPDWGTRDLSLRTLVRVQDIWLDLVDEDNRYGQLRYAQITLRGLLLPCRLFRPAHRLASPRVRYDGSDHLLSLFDSMTSQSYHVALDEPDHPHIHSDVFLLPIGAKKHSHMGLILAKRPGCSKYERIGRYDGYCSSNRIFEGYHEQQMQVTVV